MGSGGLLSAKKGSLALTTSKILDLSKGAGCESRTCLSAARTSCAGVLLEKGPGGRLAAVPMDILASMGRSGLLSTAGEGLFGGFTPATPQFFSVIDGWMLLSIRSKIG